MTLTTRFTFARLSMVLLGFLAHVWFGAAMAADRSLFLFGMCMSALALYGYWRLMAPIKEIIAKVDNNV